VCGGGHLDHLRSEEEMKTGDNDLHPTSIRITGNCLVNANVGETRKGEATKESKGSGRDGKK
jgi:hypothetical protein